jgi:hypothetical protein
VVAELLISAQRGYFPPNALAKLKRQTANATPLIVLIRLRQEMWGLEQKWVSKERSLFGTRSQQA